MKRAAVGFRVHSGWAALVAVTAVKGVPEVLVRRRIHLVKTFTYEYRQPYHTAEKLTVDGGRAFIVRGRSEARRMARLAMRTLQAELHERGYSLTRCGVLLASGRPLPSLSKILAAHSLIHSADGELFREALLHAIGRCGLKPIAVKEREVYSLAERVLRRNATDLAHRISTLGRPLGPPWTQDEKLSSLLAWLAVSLRTPVSRENRQPVLSHV